MNNFDYDLIVIGAGSGGTRTARIAAGYGAKTAVIEGDRPGGTCVLRGCVPKKLLIYGSEFSHQVEDAIGYGWKTGSFKSNWKDLISKKNKELDRLHEIYKNLIINSGCDLIPGWGKVLSAHEVLVKNESSKERKISAKKIMIAVGGKSSFPEFDGNLNMINSDEALDLKELPKSILIYGSGYIAVEFAGIFNGFGVETNLVFRSDFVLRGFDLDIRKKLTEQIENRGIKVFSKTTIEKIERSDQFITHLSNGKKILSDKVMGATGRIPNVEPLGLNEIGLKTGKQGNIIVNEFNQTNIESIYAIGDVTDRINLTPVAIAEGHAFSDREFGNKNRFISYDNVPSAVFSQPPVSVVGLTLEDAKTLNIKAKEFVSEFNPLKNTITGKQEKTLMKLVVDENDKVLGAHMLGDYSPEIIQGIAVSIKAGAKKSDFDATIGIHPTAAEEFVTMK